MSAVAAGARAFTWWEIGRLGLVQAAIGAVTVLATSTLSRIMIVELALPAAVPGALVAAHHLVQVLRPRLGHGSDARGRRGPWIVGGMGAAALGGFGAAVSVAVMRGHPGAGVALALVAFLALGLGIGAAGTALLVLLAQRTAPARRPAAATLTWVLMTVGFIICAGVAGRALEPYSPARLLQVSAAVSLATVVVTVLAVWGLEGRAPAPAEGTLSAPASPASAGAATPRFSTVLREVAAEPDTLRFAGVIFAAMLAYSGQELILEPLSGAVFGFSPGASTALMGVQRAGVLAGMLSAAVVSSLTGGRRPGALEGWTAGGCLLAALAMAAVGLGALRGPGFPLQPAVLVLGLADGVFAVSAVGAMMARVGAGAPGREGVRMGLWGAAQSVAFGLGGLVATGTVDAGRAAFPGGAGPGYAAAFGLEAALFAVAAALVRRLGRRAPAPAPSAVVAPGATLQPL